MRPPALGSPAAIAQERVIAKETAEARAEAERERVALHQEVLCGRRGDEFLVDMLSTCHVFEAVATPEEEGQRRYALRTLYHLGVLTPKNLLAIARYMLRLPQHGKASSITEQERAIRVGPGTDPQEE